MGYITTPGDGTGGKKVSQPTESGTKREEGMGPQGKVAQFPE